jgi:hypothetical protein
MAGALVDGLHRRFRAAAPHQDDTTQEPANRRVIGEPHTASGDLGNVITRWRRMGKAPAAGRDGKRYCISGLALSIRQVISRGLQLRGVFRKDRSGCPSLMTNHSDGMCDPKGFEWIPIIPSLTRALNKPHLIAQIVVVISRHGFSLMIDHPHCLPRLSPTYLLGFAVNSSSRIQDDIDSWHRRTSVRNPHRRP